MERRAFIRSACLACIAPGLGGMGAFLTSCASAQVYRAEMIDGIIRVPVSLFGPEEPHVVRATGSVNDIALVRTTNGEFIALILRCTHANNPLSYRGTEITCSLHGSRFDSAGNVTHGPATLPLQRLPSSVEGGDIVIHVSAAQSLSPASVETGGL